MVATVQLKPPILAHERASSLSQRLCNSQECLRKSHLCDVSFVGSYDFASLRSVSRAVVKDEGIQGTKDHEELRFVFRVQAPPSFGEWRPMSFGNQ